MDRRRFLKWLGVGVAAGAAAPSVIAKVGPTLSDVDERSPMMAGTDWFWEEHPESLCQSTFSSTMEYADYADFSALALSTALDATVSEAAAELSRQAGLSISDLYRRSIQA